MRTTLPSFVATPHSHQNPSSLAQTAQAFAFNPGNSARKVASPRRPSAARKAHGVDATQLHKENCQAELDWTVTEHGQKVKSPAQGRAWLIGMVKGAHHPATLAPPMRMCYRPIGDQSDLIARVPTMGMDYSWAMVGFSPKKNDHSPVAW